MTPDKPKCEHWSVDRRENYVEADGSPIGDGWFCHDCNARFVPADVLEEARAGIEKIRAAATEYKFGREYFQTGRGVHVGTEAIEKMAQDVLARIDGVLGK